MLAILAPNIPVAYLVARFAVARARRGEVPDWRRIFAWLGWIVDLLPRRRDPFFRSPADAQVWFEWRRYGRSLPALVGILLPFEVFLLFVFSDTPVLVVETLFAVLLTPPFMAAFVAATVSSSESPDGSDSYELTPFIATRPLSSASLITAKLKTTIRSTLATWLLVLGRHPARAQTLGHHVGRGRRRASGRRGRGDASRRRDRAARACGPVAFTWKQLVQSLYIGMSGRAWLVKGSVFLALSLLTIIRVLAQWVVETTQGSDRPTVGRSPLDPRCSGLLQDLRCCLDRHAPPRQPAAQRSARSSSARWVGTPPCSLFFGLLVWLLPTLLFPDTFSHSSRSWPSPWRDSPRHRWRSHGIDIASEALRPQEANCATTISAAALQRTEGGATTERGDVIGAVLVLISLPVLVALVEAVSFHVRNRNNGSIVSSGEKREYLLYVPKSYDPTRPTPLVISMHGGGGMAGAAEGRERVEPVGRQPRVHRGVPVGSQGWGFQSLACGAPGARVSTKDVRFISDLIDDLEKAYNIDPTRIYANGLSNGGGMAFVLSCTLSDRIAAVGMVAAAQMLPFDWCEDHRPVPMISFHGTDDPVVPYEGGTSWVCPRPVSRRFGVDGQDWARRNRCGPDTVESAVAADVTRRDSTDCADDAAVVLFTIHDGGHTWPGAPAFA